MWDGNGWRGPLRNTSVDGYPGVREPAYYKGRPPFEDAVLGEDDMEDASCGGLLVTDLTEDYYR